MDILQLLELVSSTFGVPIIALVAVWFAATYKSERKRDREVMHELAVAVSKLRELFDDHETRISRLEGATL